LNDTPEWCVPNIILSLATCQAVYQGGACPRPGSCQQSFTNGGRM